MSTAATITPVDVLKEMSKPTKPPFPLDALPVDLANYARELHRVDRFPLDYTACSMLFAASAAIGNAVHLKVREGYPAPPMLWLVLVGPPSVGKSHPMNRMAKALASRDARTKREHDKAVREWEAAQDERRKGKRGKDTPPDEPPTPRPVWRPRLVDDPTMEALVAKLAVMPRGLGLHCDELAGWLARFDQYRAGGDRAKWLSIWTQSTLVEIRKTAGEQLVPTPFVAVGGTMQPARLSCLSKERDGFTPRLLFAYPDEVLRHPASTASLEPRWAEMWADVVEHLVALEMIPTGDGGLEPVLLVHSKEAAEAFAVWDRMNVERTNAANRVGDTLSSELFGKLDIYAHRLALVLELLHRARGNAGNPAEVRLEAMQGALKMLDYFEGTARKVYFEIYEADEVDRLPAHKGRVYAALPEAFATADGVKVAERLGMSRSTFMRLLRDGKLFRKDAHGKWVKLQAA
jgi:hypothetical protein